jgi:alcohol dehydrogenase class IV
VTGTFNLPHAEVHTVILPHATAFNAAAAPAAMQKISRALGGAPAAQALYELAKQNGAPVSLRELGMKADDLDTVVRLALQNPYWNPRPIVPENSAALRSLLQQAWEGVAPVTVM